MKSKIILFIFDRESHDYLFVLLQKICSLLKQYTTDIVTLTSRVLISAIVTVTSRFLTSAIVTVINRFLISAIVTVINRVLITVHHR